MAVKKQNQMSLNLSKPVQCRDGRPVRILCTDAKGDRPIVGLIDLGEQEVEYRWRLDGGNLLAGAQLGIDLINAPEPKQKGTVWVSIHDPGSPLASVTAEEAERRSNLYCDCFPLAACIARVRVEWEEGRFDE